VTQVRSLSVQVTCATAVAAVSKQGNRSVCHTLLTGVLRCTVDVSLQPNGIWFKEKWETDVVQFCCIVELGRKQSELRWGACALPGQRFCRLPTKLRRTWVPVRNRSGNVLGTKYRSIRPKALFRKRSGNLSNLTLDFSWERSWEPF